MGEVSIHEDVAKVFTFSVSSTLKEGLEYCRRLQRPDGSWEGCDNVFLVILANSR